MYHTYAEGEVMELFWDGRPDQFYVRGHIDPGDARERMEKTYEGFYRFTDPIPAFGRWSMETRGWDDEPGHILRVYQEPGPGRFPIMVSDVLGEIPVYPEHEKLEKVSAFSQEIGEFLEWLGNKGVHLTTLHEHDENCEAEGCDYSGGDYQPFHYDTQKLLAEFYMIDLNKIEAEKEEMLRTMREMSNAGKEENADAKGS